MISVRQQHRIAITNDVRGTLAVGGVEKLLPEPLWRIDAEVIHLLEYRLAILAVVFVRRIAAPVSSGVERFPDHDSLRNGVVHENVVHLARVIATAPRIPPDIGGGNVRRRTAAHGRGGDKNRLERARGDD